LGLRTAIRRLVIASTQVLLIPCSIGGCGTRLTSRMSPIGLYFVAISRLDLRMCLMMVSTVVSTMPMIHWNGMLTEIFSNGSANTSFHSLIFLWLAIPWLQAELDAWVMLRNRTAPRADRNKILPHGIPELIRFKPTKFGTVDLKASLLFFVKSSAHFYMLDSRHPRFPQRIRSSFCPTRPSGVSACPSSIRGSCEGVLCKHG
jgi:hypothetical protein